MAECHTTISPQGLGEKCIVYCKCRFSATVYTLIWSSQHITLYEVWFHFRCYFRESLKMYQYKLFQLSVPKNDWHWHLSSLLPIHAGYTSKTKRRKTKKKKKKRGAVLLQYNLCWHLHDLKGWVWNTTKVTPQLSEPLPQLYPDISLPPSHSGSRIDQNRVRCDKILRWLLWPQGPKHIWHPSNSTAAIVQHLFTT